jgi:AraC family transcriptional regulator
MARSKPWITLPELSSPTAYGIALYPPGADFGPRVMRDYEFVWMIEGDAEYRWGETTVPAPEGSIVLCRPGATDAFRWDPVKRTRHGFYHFHIATLPNDWPQPGRWPLVRVPGEGDTLRPLFQHLLAWVGRGNALLSRLTMAHMLTAFVLGESSTGEIPRDALHDAVERAWTHIDQALDQDPAARISLGDMARAACVTPEHLCRLYKAATGRSPVETLRLARLDRAAVLLTRSNYGVGEIANQCGFANPFHFSRQFKHAFGQSPRQMRDSIRAGAVPPASRLAQIFRVSDSSLKHKRQPLSMLAPKQKAK